MRKFEAIRNQIKTLSEQQKILKPQRKESFKNVRTETQVNATVLTQMNKYELRHLFQAYAILKGIERSEIKKPSNYNGSILNDIKLSKMVEKFRPVEVLESE